MRKFNEFMSERNDLELATALVESGVDVNAWARQVIDVASQYELTEQDLYNEILGAALRGGLGALGGAAAQGMGNAMGAAARGVGNMANAALNKAKAVGQGMANAANTAGQNIKGTFNQGANQGMLQAANKNIMQLRNQLLKMNVAPQNVIDSHLNSLTKQIQMLQQQNAANTGAGRVPLGQGNLQMQNSSPWANLGQS
jgi:Zn-dependent alcohol dehydrogenase